MNESFSDHLGRDPGGRLDGQGDQLLLDPVHGHGEDGAGDAQGGHDLAPGPDGRGDATALSLGKNGKLSGKAVTHHHPFSFDNHFGGFSAAQTASR